MKDRQAARVRPLLTGVPAQPKGGIPMDVSDKPLEDGIEAGPKSVKGVPAGVSDYQPKGPAKCTGTTKKGSPCKAYATSGGKLCVGHGG